MASLQNWLVEAEQAVSKDIRPEEVDLVLDAYHVTLNEHSEKQPVINDINERICQAQKLTPSQATQLKVAYEPLISKYKVNLLFYQVFTYNIIFLILLTNIYIHLLLL